MYILRVHKKLSDFSVLLKIIKYYLCSSSILSRKIKILVKNSVDNVSLHKIFTEWGEGEKNASSKRKL
jgi:type III secretory pathway lipoprotein EscJ